MVNYEGRSPAASGAQAWLLTPPRSEVTLSEDFCVAVEDFYIELP